MPEPMREKGRPMRARRQSTRWLLAKLMSATAVPMDDCILLVPRARCGGRPARSRAGRVMSPPPPAMLSMKPATRAASEQKRTVPKVAVNIVSPPPKLVTSFGLPDKQFLPQEQGKGGLGPGVHMAGQPRSFVCRFRTLAALSLICWQKCRQITKQDNTLSGK